MWHGKGLVMSILDSDIYLRVMGISEEKLLNKRQLRGLPSDAWRNLWDCLAQGMRNLIAARINSGNKLSKDLSPVQIAPYWYMPLDENTWSIWRIKGGQVTYSIGDVFTVSQMLKDLNFESWKVWHVLCNIESVSAFIEAESLDYELPKKERLTNAEAYERITGWLVYQSLRE